MKWRFKKLSLVFLWPTALFFRRRRWGWHVIEKRELTKEEMERLCAAMDRGFKKMGEAFRELDVEMRRL